MGKNNIKNSIIKFSKINCEPEFIKKQRIEAYQQLGDYGHPSFGPEIKLDYEVSDYLGNVSCKFHVCGVGFIACDIHTAFNKYPELVDKYYGKLILSGENRYTILNSIAFESGYFVYVFKQQKLSFPIFNKNINCNLTRNIIIVDEDAELNIIDYCNNSAVFRCDCTEVFVENNAVCKYLNLSTGNSSTVVSIKRAQVCDNAKMHWINVIDGADIYMGYPTSILQGINAYSKSDTLALAKHENSINVGAKMIHKVPNTISDVASISTIDSSAEVEVRNVIDMQQRAISSISNIEYHYCMKGNNSKFDIVPKYILDNNQSQINHITKSSGMMPIDVIDFVECHFMKLSRRNRKILCNLLKKGK